MPALTVTKNYFSVKNYLIINFQVSIEIKFETLNFIVTWNEVLFQSFNNNRFFHEIIQSNVVMTSISFLFLDNESFATHNLIA